MVFAEARILIAKPAKYETKSMKYTLWYTAVDERPSDKNFAPAIAFINFFPL